MEVSEIPEVGDVITDKQYTYTVTEVKKLGRYALDAETGGINKDIADRYSFFRVTVEYLSEYAENEYDKEEECWDCYVEKYVVKFEQYDRDDNHPYGMSCMQREDLNLYAECKPEDVLSEEELEELEEGGELESFFVRSYDRLWEEIVNKARAYGIAYEDLYFQD
jgi:hypothetical protein